MREILKDSLSRLYAGTRINSERVRRPLKDVAEVSATVIATTIKGHCRKNPEILYKWSGSSELPNNLEFKIRH